MSDLIHWMAPWSGRVLVALVVLAGLAIACRSFLRLRMTSPRCPRCRYDMRAAASLTCPECGFAAGESSTLLRKPRRWRWVIVGLLIAISMPGYVAVRRMREYGWDYYLWLEPAHSFFGRYTVDSVSAQGSTISMTTDRRPWAYGSSRIEIEQGGQDDVVEINDGHRWFIGETDRNGKQIGRGDDVLGSGQPTVIVTNYSGGAHCCSTIYIFQINSTGEVKQIAKIEAEHGGSFEDRDGDGFPEFILPDWHWAYALTCFACLDHPDIILKFNGEAYAPSIELMRAAASAETEQDAVARIRKQAMNHRGSRADLAYSAMLERIYTGRAALAWPLFDAAYEPEWGDRDELLNDFISVLRTSPYFEHLERLNGGTFIPQASSASAASD